jgi:HD-GYP domain-containing protein (c-di-GMP phosphodiesterase class II)
VRLYPDGLVGDEIPCASRVLLTADAFDAMTSDRRYRRALGHEAAIGELQPHSGTQFDADCVAALLNALTLLGDRDLDQPVATVRIPA